jgi:CheY-like chemotaxis protein
MNVWIVDDDELFHMLVKRIAVKSGAASVVESFYHGKEASDRLLELQQLDQLPDIIFLDINMPLFDGWYFMREFAKMADEIKSNSRVYICSSSIAPDDRQKAESDQHVKAFIEKPLTSETFLKVLRNEYASA